MTASPGPHHRWTIGEFARASAVTVRTLHHYDEIGLLRAGERTRSGHRRYTEADLRRFYRVRALRSLGLPLEEIRTALDGDPGHGSDIDNVGDGDDVAALRAVLVAQLSELDARARHVASLRAAVGDLLRQIDEAEESGHADPKQIMRTLEMMSMFETYFTERQRDFLAGRRAEMGEPAVEELKGEWLDLVAGLRGHLRDDTPPGDATVHELVRRWDELAARFHGGDEQIKAATQRMWAENRSDICARIGWSVEGTDELLSYLNRARAAGEDVSSRPH